MFKKPDSGRALAMKDDEMKARTICIVSLSSSSRCLIVLLSSLFYVFALGCTVRSSFVGSTPVRFFCLIHFTSSKQQPNETCAEKMDSWLTNGSEKQALKR